MSKCYLCKKEITDESNRTIIGGLEAHKECKPFKRFKEINGGINDKAGEQARRHNTQNERRAKAVSEFRSSSNFFAEPSILVNDSNTGAKQDYIGTQLIPTSADTTVGTGTDTGTVQPSRND